METFLTSYIFLELPFQIVACLIYSLFVSIATNLRRSVSMYFITALNGLCTLNSGESLGIILNTLVTQNTGLALNITNVLMSVAMYMAGLMSLDMPAFLKALNKLSPLGYSVRNMILPNSNMMPYAFRGQTFSCGDDQRLADGSCAISTGEQVLDIFDLGDVNAPVNLCAIVITAIVYRLLAYATLKLLKTRFEIER
ncbi:putative ATP-binding cassette transporter [Armillaria luteobubalina]|uniref:ATP-binding cassette transporter n=1 Tax=Armillaria luteobubalina TaxID=153913 RepID=A0AA39QFT5_9AGAR|nr:putative ATP-binding cassette transporter [Armillaria luteobubalina]